MRIYIVAYLPEYEIYDIFDSRIKAEEYLKQIKIEESKNPLFEHVDIEEWEVK
jgi:hypothetical protein